MEPLPTEVEAHGVVLRTWAPQDAPELHHAVVASIEHLRPWMAWIGSEPLTVGDRIELIERWERERLDGGDVVFAIRQDGVVVGGAGLHRRLGEGGLEIGYWVHVDHVGRGVATAASRAATDLAFTVDGIDRVEIHHDVANVASARVPEKLGFQRLADAPSPRPDAAPAETGTDGIWRTTRRAWLGG
ncbi:GNAT family N-acetyltransferase [soil metagenome]